MNTSAFTEDRSSAIRAALVDHVQHERSAPTRGLKLTPLLAGAAALLLGAGGVTAATASGLITWPLLTQHPLPGGQTARSASETFEAAGRGNAVVDLFAAPDAATHVSVKFTCLTPNTEYTWGLDPNGNNPGSSCGEAEIGTVSATAWYDFALSADTRSLYITAEPDAVWAVAWVYLTKTDTEWGVNANGDTYGIVQEEGAPPTSSRSSRTTGARGTPTPTNSAWPTGSRTSPRPRMRFGGRTR